MKKLEKWFRRCLIRSIRTTSEWEVQTTSIGYTNHVLLKEMFAFALENSLRQGYYDNAINRTDDRQSRMSLFFVTPPDMKELLIAYDFMDAKEKLAFLAWLSKLQPTYTATYNYPDNNKDAFSYSFAKMMDASFQIATHKMKQGPINVDPKEGETIFNPDEDNR